MKLQLTKNDIPMHGYMYIHNDFMNVHTYAYPSQVTEIYAPDALKYIPLQQYHSFLSHCYSLLKKDGVLIIGGLDIILFSALIADQELDYTEANIALFNSDLKSVTRIASVKSLLQNLNFKIESISVDDSTDGEFVFTCKKNENNTNNNVGGNLT